MTATLPGMAKNAPSIAMPLDEPISVSPGITHRESDFQGNAKFGAIQGHDGSTPVGAIKGNRAADDLVPRQEAIDGGPIGRITGGKAG